MVIFQENIFRTRGTTLELNTLKHLKICFKGIELPKVLYDGVCK